MMRNKIYEILILILFFLLSSIKIVNADCNFKIRLGEDVLKIKNFVDINTEENLILEDYSISYLDVCPNENLDENKSLTEKDSNIHFNQDNYVNIPSFLKRNRD